MKVINKATTWFFNHQFWTLSFPVPDFNRLGAEREYVL